MKKIIITALLAALLLLSACGKTEAPDAPASSPAPEAAASPAAPEETPSPEESAAAEGSFASFSCTDIDGNPVDESIFAAHEVTMVNVWASYCGPCIREMPDLAELSDEYAERGFQIVGLLSDGGSSDGGLREDAIADARDIIADTGADYLHLIPSNAMFGEALAEVYAVPTTYFVDSEGLILGEAHIGSQSKEAWADIIVSLLDEAGA